MWGGPAVSRNWCGVVAKRWPTATATTASIQHLVSAYCLRQEVGAGQKPSDGDGGGGGGGGGGMGAAVTLRRIIRCFYRGAQK